MTRTPVQVVDTYLDVLYNQRRLDLVPELIADPTWRHAPGEVKQLSLAQSMERLGKLLDLCPVLRFETAVRVVEGPLVTVAWNGWSTQTSGKSYTMSGIEIFRVMDGRIVEIWNSREAAGLWQATQTF
ncbi:ester cyclase [Vineibacter terrae]|uniref:Ester cyclase n=1 Tax=Vineibacter terrae TaxID=2586908 RepID=A0A5C8PM66_9HYPH|nr:ester cyclase [Vineibacter terrae]TXL75404.1 ester cyclase [Vineibacter terrae]